MDVKCVQEAATEFIFYLVACATVFPIYIGFLSLNILCTSLSLSLSHSFRRVRTKFFSYFLRIWIFIMNSPRAVFKINRCQLRMYLPQQITK